MEKSLSAAHKFKLWKNNLVKNGLKINGIEEVYTKFKHDGDALFSLVMLDATTPEGDKIPPICFLKGQIVSVLICLIDVDTQEKFLLLVKQRRICNGDYIYEQVAGMVDGSDHPHDVALREVEEETGLIVSKNQVHLLNEEPYYCSTGTSDEALFFYYVELEVTADQIASYHNNKHGLESEHERIFTHVATIPESMRLITNTNGLLNIYMYLEKVAS